MRLVILVIVIILAGCAGPRHGPDKQFAGSMRGAVSGAGAGAITGAQLSAGSGPGAAVGAGLGAVAGGITGAIQDSNEEKLLRLSAMTQEEREVAYAHEVLADQFERRMELHPNREIYPADLFFQGDEVSLKYSARPIVRELARLNKERYPWSRLVIASYVKASDEKSTYANFLGRERSQSLGDAFIAAGIEPRRLELKVVIVEAPVLIDPDDNRGRYNQAVELIPIDR